jgi:single-strand DNA-binding protein
MAGYQYTQIIGNVGRDPEIRYTPDGVAVCDFSVAVTEHWEEYVVTDEDGCFCFSE